MSGIFLLQIALLGAGSHHLQESRRKAKQLKTPSAIKHVGKKSQNMLKESSLDFHFSSGLDQSCGSHITRHHKTLICEVVCFLSILLCRLQTQNSQETGLIQSCSAVCTQACGKTPSARNRSKTNLQHWSFGAKFELTNPGSGRCPNEMHSTAIRASKSSTKGAKLKRAAGKKDSDEVTGRPITSPMLLTSGPQMQAEERSRRTWSGEARLKKAPAGNHAYSCLFALA